MAQLGSDSNKRKRGWNEPPYPLKIPTQEPSICKECGIFVRGFPPNTGERDIVEYFSRFGSIIWAHFGHDFALLDFTEFSSVERVLEIKLHFLNGRRLIVKQKRPKIDIAENEKNKEERTFSRIIDKLKYMNDFIRETHFLVHQLQSNPKGYLRTYNRICQDIYRILSPVFPNAEVNPFGSTITGLGFNNSDIDVFIANVRNPYQDEIDCLNVIKQLLCQSGIFRNVLLIKGAKIPIIKCLHQKTKTKCDVNIKNMLSVCNSKLIRYYINSHEKVKTAMITLKYWGKVHKITGQNHLFTNYSLALLFIFFLQQKPYNLPSVCYLQQSTPAYVQDFWCGDFVPDYKYNCDEIIASSEVELLKGFFRFYRDFSYHTDVICPYLGKIVPKSCFQSTDSVPNDFVRYKDYISQEGNLPLKVDSPICLQDPFEHCRNSTGVITDSHLEKFASFCRLGERICEQQDQVLFKLLVDVPPNLKKTECSFNESHLEITLYKPSNTKYLQAKNSDGNKNEDNLWFEAVIEFVEIIFKDVLVIDIAEISETASTSKNKKIAGQVDVYDTAKRNYMCCCKINFWDSRKAQAKQVNLDDFGTLLEKEIAVTNHLKNLYKNFQDVQNIIKFKLTLEDKQGEVAVILDKISAYKKSFKSFGRFIVNTLPVWFETYQRDLNKAIN